MTDIKAKELPVLPEPCLKGIGWSKGYFDKEQLQSYGAACAAHAREVALSEVLRRVRGATGGAIQPNDWWVGFKTARTQFTNAIEQLKAGK